MDRKDRYTQIFLRAAHEPTNRPNIQKYKLIWWYSLREKNEGGLRLTDQGLGYVKNKADIKTYTIQLPKDFKMTAQVVIWLDQFIDSPFHINKKEITVLSEKAAFELYLFSGDVKKMGHSKAMAKRLSHD